jgi:hypothetical protein
MVILSSVMNFPIHDYPSDYWRFTPKACELLLQRFSVYEVESDGDPQFPEGVYGFGIKGGSRFLQGAGSLNPMRLLRKLTQRF